MHQRRVDAVRQLARDALIVGGTPVNIIADRPLDQTIGGVRIRANQFDAAPVPVPR